MNPKVKNGLFFLRIVVFFPSWTVAFPSVLSSICPHKYNSGIGIQAALPSTCILSFKPLRYEITLVLCHLIILHSFNK